MANTCPICERRRAKRACPGLASSRWPSQTGSICAQCCGEQREVTITCPAECPYLVAAHRYEQERRPPPGEPAFAQVRIDNDFLGEHQALIGSLSLAVVRFAREHDQLFDPDLLAALDALARGYQTLDSGLYYEQPPENAPARALYSALQEFVKEYQQESQQRAGISLRPGDFLRAAVFLRRIGQLETNGRGRSRRFLEFLRRRLPAEATGPAASASPLIVPGR